MLGRGGMTGGGRVVGRGVEGGEPWPQSLGEDWAKHGRRDKGMGRVNPWHEGDHRVEDVDGGEGSGTGFQSGVTVRSNHAPRPRIWKVDGRGGEDAHGVRGIHVTQAHAGWAGEEDPAPGWAPGVP